MKKSTLLLAVLLLLTTVLNSCGVMFGGSKYHGTIVAKDHPNAQIYVEGKQLGVGETSSLFKRNKPLVVELKQDGCESETHTFDKTFRVANFILSVFSFGIIGAGIDLGTGAAYKPDHKNDDAITKLSDKNYKFDVDYSGCEKP